MVATASTMLELGTKAPDFTLPDTTGNSVRLADLADAKVLVVMFICNHCPFVKHLRKGLADFARDYQSKGVAVVAINSNDVENYPDDSPAKMAEEVKAAGYTFPYLYDETQNVAKAYRAACTPDFFVFDGHQKLVYRGQFDDSRPNNGVPVTGTDLLLWTPYFQANQFRGSRSRAWVATSNGSRARRRSISGRDNYFSVFDERPVDRPICRGDNDPQHKTFHWQRCAFFARRLLQRIRSVSKAMRRSKLHRRRLSSRPMMLISRRRMNSPKLSIPFSTCSRMMCGSMPKVQ